MTMMPWLCRAAIAVAAVVATGAVPTTTRSAPAAKPAPRVITYQVSGQWRVDPLALAYWCQRTERDVGALAWFAEFRDLDATQRGDVLPILDRCIKRRLEWHGRVGLALPAELAARVAKGEPFTAEERWMLGYIDHFLISDALIAEVGGATPLAALLTRPELRGIAEARIEPGPQRSACAWVYAINAVPLSGLRALYVSPRCDDALTKPLPTLPALEHLTSSGALASRWQPQLPALAHFAIAEDPALGVMEHGAPSSLRPFMSVLRLAAADLPLLRGQALPAVRELTLEMPTLTSAHLQILSGATAMPNLTKLTIVVTQTPLSREIMSQLWDALAFGGLVDLTLVANASLGREGAMRLRDSAMLRRLHTLAFEGVLFDDSALELLGDGAAVLGLKTLALRMAGLTRAKLAVLANARTLRPYRLDLSNNPLGGEALKALSRGGLLTELRELTVRDAGLDDRAARALTEVYGLHQLARLDLSGNALTETAQRALLGAASLASLGWLDMYEPSTSDLVLCAAMTVARPMPRAPCAPTGPFRGP